MSDGNTKPAGAATPTNPLDESIDRYAKGLDELESAAPNPSFEKIIEVLVARDVIETRRTAEQNPSGASIAKLIELDSRLKEQCQAIATQPKLSEWKENLNIPPTSWWWDLGKQERQLQEVIGDYKEAIDGLEAALPQPNSKLLLKVLLARDAVEEVCSQEKRSSPESLVEISDLDKRLQAHAKPIAEDGTLDEWKKILNRNSRWWQLTDPDAIPNKAIKSCEEALSVLESAQQNPIPHHLIRDVLLARDAVEQIRQEEKNPPQERIDQIMRLDERLWAKAGVIAKEEQVDKWKVHFNPPASHWWWQITTESPYFFQCVERYQKVLEQLEENAHNPSPEQVEQALKVLKARDALEKAIKNQPSLPEGISQEIVKLDQRLKQLRPIFTRGKQLLNWKKSLNPSSSDWWWNFKPSIFGDEDDSMSFLDRLWIGAALVCIAIAAGLVVNTTQTFQAFGQGKDKDGVRSADALQNVLVIVQGAGLLGLTGAAVTQKGQKLLENLLTSIPFLRPTWQAPATFGLSAVALSGAWVINQSLPMIGDWLYFKEGQKLVEDGELYKAREKFLQAKKLVTDADIRTKLSLELGKVYEQQGKLSDAVKEYENAGTDDPEVLNRLGRAMLLDGLQEVGWAGKMAKDAIVHKADSYLQQAEKKISSGGKVPKNIEDRLLKEIYINQGILHWAKVDFKKQSPSDNNVLELARDKFIQATNYENRLPTTPDGRNARCYLELAKGLIREQEITQKLSSLAQKKGQNGNLYCKKILDLGINDLNDANLMRSIYDLLIERFSQTPLQSTQTPLQQQSQTPLQPKKTNQPKQIIQQRTVKTQ